jgi:predicted transposase YbfD/YdcC
MEAVMEIILGVLREVRDPRAANAQHDLCEVLFIALCACICGAQTCCEMAAFGRAKEDFLRRMLRLAHGIPSHDTFSRVFRLIDPGALAQTLGRFAGAFGQAARGVVCVDGKSLRRGYEAGRAHMPPMMVSVWAQETRMTLSQAVAQGGDEAKAAIEALQLLNLKGCTVTADALHCHAGTAKAVIALGGDYVLALKANQPGLLAQAEAAFMKPQRGTALAETAEEAHGRSETRSACVAPLVQKGARKPFPKLAAAARIDRQRSIDGKTVTTRHYYLMSKRMPAAMALAAVRKHWDIENGLHWRLDMVFDEDRARNRKDNGPANLAVLRRITMNFLKAHPAKSSIAIKRSTAGWNDAFLIEILTHMR